MPKPVFSLADDLALIRHAVCEAGRLAESWFGRPQQVMDKPDGTQVGEADLATNALLRDRLMSARPGYGWLSEEEPDDGSRLTARRSFVIDPIDGTRAFLKGRPEWAVSVGLIEAGQPVAGGVYNPAAGELYLAARGLGAVVNDRPARVVDRSEIAGSRLVVPQGFVRRFAAFRDWPPYQQVWANSMAWRICLVAGGKADATISMSNKSDWDLAAAHIIIEEAGGVMTAHDGAPLRYDEPDVRQRSILAAAPQFHARLMQDVRDIQVPITDRVASIKPKSR